MLTNYTASMFHCCDCYNIKSNLTIRLDFDNILRPHLMTSFIPLPSPYRWYDSRPVRQAMALHNKQTITQWQVDTLHDRLFAIALHTGSTVAEYFALGDLILQTDLLTTTTFPFRHEQDKMSDNPTCLQFNKTTDTPSTVTPHDFDINLSSQKSYKQRLYEQYGDLSNVEWSAHYTAIMDNPSFMLSARQDNNTTRVPIILDTGCSFAVTFCLDDYYCPPIRGNFGTIKQVDGTKSDITGHGIGAFQVPNNKGELITMTMPMFYVPDCKQRLMSPQDYAAFHDFPREYDTVAYSGNSAFFSIKLQEDNGVLTVNINSASNIPIAFMEPLKHSRQRPSKRSSLAQSAHIQAQHTTDASENDVRSLPDSHCDATAALDILDEDNENLTPAQKTLLLDHQRLGHINMQHLQTLYTDHRIDCDFDGCSKDCGTACLPARHRSVASCSIPLCFACRQAKAKKRPIASKRTQDLPSKQHILSRDKLKPGERISLDQYQSSVR